ncbi:MAG: acyl CoA:acetate/3-ketoacid CoA transferase [Desulfatirhabdiaceae bacterium]
MQENTMTTATRDTFAPVHPTTRKNKIVTAEDAVRLIKDGDVLATSGIVRCVSADYVLDAIERAFLESGRPRDLTILMASCIGNSRADGPRVGLNRLAHEGLVGRAIIGHWGMSPKLGELASAEKIEAYNFPQGVLSQLFREMAGGKPGLLTKVGLGTFIDPRNDGGKINARTTRNLVELMQIGGEEYLFYHAVRPDIAVLRGTTADIDGNISMEREALFMEVLPVATAVHNNGGIVIVQVERITDRHTIHPRDVKIPGILVDCVVVSEPGFHWQTGSTAYNPVYASRIRVPAAAVEPALLTERKVIARRAAFEIQPNSLINLGIGMPEGVGAVANEEKVSDLLTMTNEPGGIGGIPQGGLDFGTVVNVEALIDQPSMFDIYDGGALDCAFLGMAQVDREGNVNVSKFGPKMVGVGGFVNISQNAKSLVFMGTFVAGKQALSVRDNGLHIELDGTIPKFVDRVDQLTFSGKYASGSGQRVLYVTERCVFALTRDGMELIEVAPGIDLERDVLAKMAFKPLLRKDIRLMDKRIFSQEPMGLRDILLGLPLEQRLTYDAGTNTLFANFEGISVKDMKTVKQIASAFEQLLAPLKHKVNVVANFDNFEIYPDILDEYTDMALGLKKRFFEASSVYTTSAFLRMQLGKSLAARGVAPHIAWTREEAIGRVQGAPASEDENRHPVPLSR